MLTLGLSKLKSTLLCQKSTSTHSASQNGSMCPEVTRFFLVTRKKNQVIKKRQIDVPTLRKMILFFGLFRGALRKSETILLNQLSILFHKRRLRFPYAPRKVMPPPPNSFTKEKYMFPDKVCTTPFVRPKLSRRDQVNAAEPSKLV